MTILSILEYPDERLLRVAAPVTVFDEALKTLCANMGETMYNAKGVGLAATQVDVHQRIFVADCSAERASLQVFINPEILQARGEKTGEEGCLSLPDVRENVTRAAEVLLRAQNVLGEFFTVEATELFAVCAQHEIDHLNGILFIHHLSRLKQTRLRTRLIKQRRARAA